MVGVGAETGASISMRGVRAKKWRKRLLGFERRNTGELPSHGPEEETDVSTGLGAGKGGSKEAGASVS